MFYHQENVSGLASHAKTGGPPKVQIMERLIFLIDTALCIDYMIDYKDSVVNEFSAYRKYGLLLLPS